MPPALTQTVHVCEVSFVADEHDDDTLIGGMLVGFFDPLAEIFKGGAAGDVVDEDGSDCAAIVGSGDGLVGFLTGLDSRSITVSHICNLMTLLLILIVLEPNSTPMVGSESTLKSLSMNCMSMQDLPTPSCDERYSGRR